MSSKENKLSIGNVVSFYISLLAELLGVAQWKWESFKVCLGLQMASNL